MIYISKNIKDTEKIAKEFMNKINDGGNSSVLKQATVVGLYGDLGVGKTAFVQMVGRILNIKRKINSPTFVVMKRYSLGKASRFKNLFHLDAYRLKNEKELLHLGWEEIIKNPENIIFIEWPENVKKAMPRGHHKIKIAHLPTGQAGIKEGHRKFKML